MLRAGGPATYHHRVRGKMVGDEHSTSERTLSLREYKALLKTRDPGRLKIKKTRRAFLWRDEYYMLDTFHSPESASGTTTLFVEAPKGEFSFPPFLEAKVPQAASSHRARLRNSSRGGDTPRRLATRIKTAREPPQVDVTTKHWFSSSAHDSYARTMMLAGEVASDPFDGDANADPRRGAW